MDPPFRRGKIMIRRRGPAIIGVCLAVLWILAGASALADPVRGREPAAAFYKGAGHYEAEKYDQAIAEYTSLLNQGWESGPLYYNLGNCFFKKGELGRALLFYERARRLIPRDEDLESNYQYAQSLVYRDAAAEVAPWHVRIAGKIGGQFTVNEVIWFLSVIYWVIVSGLLLIGLIRASKKYVLPVLVFAAVLAIPGGAALYAKLAEIESTAMVIREDVEAKFEPFDRATTHFALHEGMKVRILGRKGGWVKISRSDKRVGWVKALNIEKI
jgi:tetratricopeptide (TPR) repeat protein